MTAPDRERATARGVWDSHGHLVAQHLVSHPECDASCPKRRALLVEYGTAEALYFGKPGDKFDYLTREPE